MRIYNTLTKQKDKFVPIKKDEIKIYACGPTVYNYIHIGNARPMCVFDVLRKYLEYRGNKVIFVQNFTDIDDKIINRANEENLTFKDISERYIEEYKVDAKGLNIASPTHTPKATENIDKIIEIVSNLQKNGYAYEKNGDVYFRTSKYRDYGCLSHMPIKDLESGSRIDINSQKENPLDFVLWKSAKSGEPSWISPWGAGRPGWHIECTAMINNILGSTIDIHCGGQDLIFPHHENEIAQSVCYTGKKYVNYWMHNGYINVDNKKMSKSLGNFFTVRDVASEFGYQPIRFLMLQVHYRSPINYSYDVLNQCVASLERLNNCKKNIEYALKNSAKDIKMNERDKEKILSYKKMFIDHMDDDLNTADAISDIFELTKEINIHAMKEDNVSKDYLMFARQIFCELTNVLGILYNNEEENIADEINKLVELRQEARKNKDFKRADEIRKDIHKKGYILEDTVDGVKIKKR